MHFSNFDQLIVIYPGHYLTTLDSESQPVCVTVSTTERSNLHAETGHARYRSHESTLGVPAILAVYRAPNPARSAKLNNCTDGTMLNTCGILEGAGIAES